MMKNKVEQSVEKNISWTVFSVENIFPTLIRGNNKSLDTIGRGNTLPYIGAKYNNNGVTGFIDYTQYNANVFEGNAIVFIMTGEGSVGMALYKTEKFIPSNNVYVGYGKYINRHNSQLIVSMINKQENKYNYGYIRNDKRLKREKILLPTTPTGEPDYVYMETYIKSLEQQKEKQYLDYITKRVESLKGVKKPLPLEYKEWKKFRLDVLFSFSGGKAKGLNHLKQKERGISYLGATNLNNGVMTFVERIDRITHKGNAIAFIRNGEGSMGYSVYKHEDFIATPDITVGYNKNLNKHIGLFITTIADTVRGKYNFGYKRNLQRLSAEIIQIPTDSIGKPDYEYMEQYMKYLEYQKLSAYLEFKIRKK